MRLSSKWWSRPDHQGQGARSGIGSVSAHRRLRRSGSDVQACQGHRHAGVHLRHAGALRGLGAQHRAQQLNQRRQPRAASVCQVPHRHVSAPGSAAALVPRRLRGRALILIIGSFSGLGLGVGSVQQLPSGRPASGARQPQGAL